MCFIYIVIVILYCDFNLNCYLYLYMRQTDTTISEGFLVLSTTHLVLIEVCDDHAHKQSESDHAAQEHKDMYVDAMDLKEQPKENTL